MATLAGMCDFLHFTGKEMCTERRSDLPRAAALQRRRGEVSLSLPTFGLCSSETPSKTNSHSSSSTHLYLQLKPRKNSFHFPIADWPHPASLPLHVSCFTHHLSSPLTCPPAEHAPGSRHTKPSATHGCRSGEVASTKWHASSV